MRTFLERALGASLYCDSSLRLRTGREQDVSRCAVTYANENTSFSPAAASVFPAATP